MQIVYLVLAVAWIVLSTAKLKIHPFLSLIVAALGYGLLAGMPLGEIVKCVNNGFGNTVGSIGIVIIAGCIIGTFLKESGGAYKMAGSVLKLVGEKNVHFAMLILGYIISIPVFCDSGFVILTPLNKAVSKRAKVSLAGTAIALSLGLFITHCLVPPTPGPVAAAGIMGADLGLVIFTGLGASVFALVAAWLFVSKYASKTQIDPAPDESDEQIARKISNAPSALKSFLPIVIPLILIVLNSISSMPSAPFGTGKLSSVISFVGEPVIALLIGMCLSFTLPKKLDLSVLSSSGWVGESLVSAAIIIMITAAGGSFGMVLRDSGIADTLGKYLSEAHLGIWLPFIIAAALKTAQGSSTVAIITTASLVAPMMSALGFVSPLDTALAVSSLCAGAMVVSHANDSFFWVVTQLSGMTVKQGYKLQTVGSLVCGLASMLPIWAMYLLLG